MKNLFTKSIKFVLPVAVIAVALFTARLITANKPEPQIRPSAASMAVVDTTRLVASAYPVTIRSQGTVRPTLANTLVPAVDGAIIRINELFVVGGAFSQGDVLLQIDPRDYEIALKQAQANLAQAEAGLLEQQALADQAQLEWDSLGRRGQPSELTLRKPQLAAASAQRDAAKAQVQRAELDLERTRVVAPYDGIVSERLVDTGQFVGRGAPVGSIHSIDAVDVRLPLTNRQLTYLQLPGNVPEFEAPDVELRASIGSVPQVWTGTLIRAEGIDSTTQQLNVVARINQPYTQADQPLRVGQFVQALIEGQVLEEVFVIPLSALREATQVLVVDENDELQRRTVSVAWSDDEVAAIDGGLNEGDLLVLTPMSTVADGTPVRVTIDGVAPEQVES